MISLLCPTRGRPRNVIRMIESVLGLASHEVEIVLYVDSDDQQTINMLSNIHFLEVTPFIGPRITLSQMWNECAKIARYDILGLSDDDVVYRTMNWDELIIKAFKKCEDKILLVHGRDGIHDQNLGTHPFIHRRWVDTVGYFVPPYFSGDYADTWLNHVADNLGRRKYIPELYTEHMHPAIGKAPMDTTYQERLNRQEDCASIYNSKVHERLADADKLREVMR